MRHRRIAGWVAVAALGMPAAAARAASNPTTAQVFIKCGVVDDVTPGEKFKVPKCKDVNDGKDGWIPARLDWYVGGQLAFQEQGPFFVVSQGDRGEIEVFLDGNGDPATFERAYLDPQKGIFGQPDVSWQLYIEKDNKPPALVASQPYVPMASALWAKHSEDSIGLQTGIDSEQQRAQAAESALASAISQESAARATGDSQLGVAIAAERNARMGADQTIDAELATEAQQRAASDAQLSSNLASEAARAQASESAITSSLSTEIARAQASESALSSSVASESARAQATEGTMQVATSGEASRAQAAESALQSSLAGEVSRAQAVEAALSSSLGSETTARKQGDADTLATSKAYTDAQAASESAARQAADANLQAALNAETVRAQGAEASLSSSAMSETMRATGAEASIASDLANETVRAKAAEATTLASVTAEAARAGGVETTIQSNLAAEIARATGAENTIAASLAAETTRAKAAEALLTANLNNESMRAEGAEGTLTTGLNNEVGRAQGAEGTLTTNLNNEVSRAQGAEGTLTTNLNNEVTRATTMDNTLQSNINGVSSSLTAYQALLKAPNGAGINNVGNALDWTNLKGVPTGVATGYSAGANISISGATIALSGVVPSTNGGTGINTAPTAAGQFLRSSGPGVWAISALSASDIPSLSATYMDLGTNQTIAGIKTFSSVIAGSITGNAGTVTNGLYSTGSYSDPSWLTALSASKIVGAVASALSATNFTGALSGDVTGNEGTTRVTALQGFAVATIAPTDGQVLKWSAGANRWQPAADAGGTASLPQCGTGQILVSTGTGYQCQLACNGGNGQADCNSNAGDGCETNITNSFNNCGGCGNVCATGRSCNNAICSYCPTGCTALSATQCVKYIALIDCIAPNNCGTSYNPNHVYSCSGANYGFTWTDNAATSPTSATLEFNQSVSCLTTAMTQPVQFNGNQFSSYTQSANQCTCSAGANGVESFSLPIGSYVRGGTNSFLITPALSNQCVGFAAAYNGGTGYAKVTLNY